MTRTRVKICGVRDADMAKAAADAGADAIGLVFVEHSPRFITLEKAERVVRALPAFIEPVALFVDANVDQVWATCEALGVRTVQLHGGETPTYVDQLVDVKVIKSVSFTGHDVSAITDTWTDAPANVAALLWDTPPSHPEALPGGKGKAFDWSSLAAVRDTGAVRDLPPLILAGGLTPDNVADAIATVRPYAVDVSSGVESSRGVKDAGLIHAFCEAVREANRVRI